VLRALLWRFHGADGGGRCFASYEKIAAAAKCARSSVAVAIRELEDAGLLTWVNRIARIRRQVEGLFGPTTELQVVSTSNGYSFVDPLEREPGRRVWRKSENRTRPQKREKKKDGASLVAARVIQEETSRAPPEQTERPEIALRREHIPIAGALLSTTERVALVTRLDQKPTRADWAAYGAQLDAMLRSSR
jgi:helix-turn-helix protein